MCILSANWPRSSTSSCSSSSPLSPSSSPPSPSSSSSSPPSSSSSWRAQAKCNAEQAVPAASLSTDQSTVQPAKLRNIIANLQWDIYVGYYSNAGLSSNRSTVILWSQMILASWVVLEYSDFKLNCKIAIVFPQINLLNASKIEAIAKYHCKRTISWQSWDIIATAQYQSNCTISKQL